MRIKKKSMEKNYLFEKADKSSLNMSVVPVPVDLRGLSQNDKKILRLLCEAVQEAIPICARQRHEDALTQYAACRKQAQTKKDAQKQNQTLIIHPSSSKTYQTKLKLQQRNEYNEAQIKGNILHEILSKITNENEIEKAVKAVAANYVDYYMNEAKKVMQLFKEKNWLTNEWTSLNERAVYYKNENLRADKVLWNNDTCIIIDFKTGAKENNHIQQIKKYKEAYTQLLSANTQAYLLYTDTLELQAI